MLKDVPSADNVAALMSYAECSPFAGGRSIALFPFTEIYVIGIDPTEALQKLNKHVCVNYWECLCALEKAFLGCGGEVAAS